MIRTEIDLTVQENDFLNANGKNSEQVDSGSHRAVYRNDLPDFEEIRRSLQRVFHQGAASAMQSQVDAINEARRAAEQRHYDNERANREASRQADQMRYANERMFRESQERASEESLKSRRCAEELARKGKYGIWSGCP